MMNQEVRQIMTKNPVTTHPGQSLLQVTKIMIDNKLQQIPVISESKLVGLITVYDLWKLDNKDQKTLTVEEAMTTNVLTIRPKDKLGTAAELFADKRFKTLPVVNLRNEFKGVVTAFDVIRQAFIKEFPDPILYKDRFIGDK